MKKSIKVLIFGLVWMGVAFAAFGEDRESQRNEKGYLVTQDNYLNIPSDMKVRKVANNVITPEPDTDYLARKIEEQNHRLDAMQARLDEMEKRLKSQ